jgi:hypothetical protein
MFERWLTSGTGNYMVWRDFGRPGPLVLSLAQPLATARSLYERYAYPALRRSRAFNLLDVVRHGTDYSDEPATYINLPGGRIRLLPGDYRSKAALGETRHHAFDLALDAFTQLDAVARRNGAQVLFVLQPGKEEVYLPLVESNVPDITRALRGAFDERGIEYLDLTPAFRQRAAAGARLFFEEDGHPNPEGYALIASNVLSHVRENARRYGLQTAPVAERSPVSAAAAHVAP